MTNSNTRKQVNGSPNKRYIH